MRERYNIDGKDNGMDDMKQSVWLKVAINLFLFLSFSLYLCIHFGSWNSLIFCFFVSIFFRLKHEIWWNLFTILLSINFIETTVWAVESALPMCCRTATDGLYMFLTISQQTASFDKWTHQYFQTRKMLKFSKYSNSSHFWTFPSAAQYTKRH